MHKSIQIGFQSTFGNYLIQYPVGWGLMKYFARLTHNLQRKGAWHLCGGDANVRETKKDGSPIVLYGEDIIKMDLSDYCQP